MKGNMKAETNHKKVWGHGYYSGLKEAKDKLRGDAQFNCTNSMVCWNPGTDQVKIVPWPDYGRLSQGYQCTGLGCYLHVQKMNFESRKAMAFITAMHIIIQSECDPKSVHNAFLSLEEYCDGCSDDMLSRV